LFALKKKWWTSLLSGLSREKFEIKFVEKKIQEKKHELNLNIQT